MYGGWERLDGSSPRVVALHRSVEDARGNTVYGLPLVNKGERSMAKRHPKSAALALVIGLTTFASIALLPSAAQAACKGGFCTSGSDTYPYHYVTFTSTWKADYFNFRTPQGQQYEVGRNVRSARYVLAKRGTKQTYYLQACNGGGVFETSTCTPWTAFTHTSAY